MAVDSASQKRLRLPHPPQGVFPYNDRRRVNIPAVGSFAEMSGDVYAITELDTGSIAEKLASELELELIQTHMTVVSKGSQSRSFVWVCITLMVIKI